MRMGNRNGGRSGEGIWYLELVDAERDGENEEGVNLFPGSP